jgi:hypothetical protein
LLLQFYFFVPRKGAVNSGLGNTKNFFGAATAVEAAGGLTEDDMEHRTSFIILFHHHRFNGEGRVTLHRDRPALHVPDPWSR